MSPALIAIAGPLNGTTIELAATEVCIGREAGTQVCLPSAWVSRRHCALRRQGDSVVIQDLDSRNGTFVNGIPITRQELKHGDLLTVGDCSFRFVCQEETEAAAQSAQVQLEETNTAMLAPLWMAAGEAGHFDPRAGAGADARALRDLRALLTIAGKTSAVEDSESLYWQL